MIKEPGIVLMWQSQVPIRTFFLELSIGIKHTSISMKFKKIRHSIQARLVRVERKCDLIITEVVMLRAALTQRPKIDDVVNQLNAAAKRMANQCEQEREAVRRLYNRQDPIR